MKLTNLGLRTKKSIGSVDCYISELFEQSGQLKKFSAGCFGFGTMLVKIKRNIEDIIRKHLDDVGCAEVQYSLIQTKKFWEKSGRWDKYVESGTMFTTSGRHGEYALAATAEEMSVEMLNESIRSYKDLGFCHYQIGTKFRDEIRVQGGLLKSKEFNMMDAYSFDETKEKMIKKYEIMKDVYHKIFKDLGFDDIKNIVSINDMGGTVASEFMFFDDEYGQDTIYCNDELNLYVNEEVFELEDINLKKEILGEFYELDKSHFEKRKAIELGHIFQNDQIYSKMLNGTFADKNGKIQNYYNGCYGIGVSRLLILIAVNSINKYKKLIWDSKISAFDVAVICKNDTDCMIESENIYTMLKNNGIKVYFDDRNFSLGEKIKDCELFGIKSIVIVGNNFLNDGTIDLENRKIANKKNINKTELMNMLCKD